MVKQARAEYGISSNVLKQQRMPKIGKHFNKKSSEVSLRKSQLSFDTSEDLISSDHKILNPTAINDIKKWRDLSELTTFSI